ncbi:hypothetical protein HID58_054474 [Brassica napus]|uniref:S-protein homolog n=1 Tax=Brassica napus TaxID=3708 RepID=A0ABQ8AJ29_BRANA|nr:hypothetical protein HID58_054474 [Brassica napus]
MNHFSKYVFVFPIILGLHFGIIISNMGDEMKSTTWKKNDFTVKEKTNKQFRDRARLRFTGSHRG